VGGRSGSWFLKNYKNSLSHTYDDWREYLWMQIFEKNIAKIKVNNWEAMLIFLFHPSERSGIGWFIDRKLKNAIQKLINEVKGNQ
jgi:hypothetical protein